MCYVMSFNKVHRQLCFAVRGKNNLKTKVGWVVRDKYFD